MKIFISDLHLGDGSGSDDFHRTKSMFSFLDFVKKEADELIILGDLFDLWQAHIYRVLFAHSDLIKKIFSIRKNIEVTYVVGNHDYLPFARLTDFDIGIKQLYKDKEKKIVAEHGHKYDIFNRYSVSKIPLLQHPLGRHMSAAIGKMERAIHPDFDKWTKKAIKRFEKMLLHVKGVKGKVPPSTKEYLDRGGHFGEFEEAVKKHLKNGAKIVIFGHTHRAQLERINGGIYANCGAWVDEVEPTYVALGDERIELRNGLTHECIKAMDLNE